MEVFERKLYRKMKEWKELEQGRTALLIQGARRVGKTTLAKTFAQKEYKSFLLIDFSSCSQEVMELFNDISNLNYLFLRLQMIYHVILQERESVIVLDEIQLCPKARQAIKEFVADGRYDFIETGSLISIRKNIEKIRIPSEETRLQLHPLDYEEFLWALGDKVTVPLLKQTYNDFMKLGDKGNRDLLRDFRVYMLVGGMPQAVSTYSETNNMELVDRTKRQILQLYEEDFNKIDPNGRASAMFQAIPALLNSNASRYQVAKAVPGGRADRLAEVIYEM